MSICQYEQHLIIYYVDILYGDYFGFNERNFNEKKMNPGTGTVSPNFSQQRITRSRQDAQDSINPGYKQEERENKKHLNMHIVKQNIFEMSNMLENLCFQPLSRKEWTEIEVSYELF